MLRPPAIRDAPYFPIMASGLTKAAVVSLVFSKFLQHTRTIPNITGIARSITRPAVLDV